jgi:hypothetical protein
MPMVWTEQELRGISRSLPPDAVVTDRDDPGHHGTQVGTHMVGLTHPLTEYVRFWNSSPDRRQHTRKHHPDVYGAMMLPLKEIPKCLGDPAARYIIEWRLRNRR